MEYFFCLALTPIGLEHPGVSVAAARAGAIGILDREFCPVEKQELAQKNLDQLLSLTRSQDIVGLRLRTDQIAESQSLLKALSARQHWLILCGWNRQSLKAAIQSLPRASHRQLLIEVLDAEQVRILEDLNLQVDGLVARGHESGGWVGEDSAFILSQKLLKIQSRPVYVQGGIGMHTSAACRAAGAAGVVLDDQLWFMPESPLAKTAQNTLKNLNGQEAILIGERLGQCCRVLSRPGFQAIATLQKLAERIEIEQDDETVRLQDWQNQAQPWIGWDQPGVLAWPVGQAVGLASRFFERYKTTGRLIQAILDSSQEHIQTAQSLKPLQPNSPLAVSHKTQYPIVQGPMTRVSDVAEFAQAIAQGGALPMLALALMRQPQVKELLYQAKDLMADLSWGVGILGFVPQALREAQLEVIREVKPPFALIAGGRPDQAARLEAEGIATYIHVPTPVLLAQFIEAGAKRFIFEGRECGGHVGPLSSFTLWESAIDTLLTTVAAGTESDIHILFAGGIHDSLSASMIATLAAPLARRGMKVGVLMGTAYILTQEAVEHGAIVPEFQQQILDCTRTINLETGPGHASRCAVTPFAQEFYQTRRRLAASGHSPEEIKDALEDLTLGRLRIASKGITRDQQGNVITIDEDQQIVDGMYMIGQVATLRDQRCSIPELHEEVSALSTQRLMDIDLPQQPESLPSPSDIAIVGISTLLPKAQYPDQYWENILQSIDALEEIPSHRWDWHLYYNPERHTRDKIYSKWGGFLEDVAFDPMRFGIPPKSLKSIEPMQLLALEAVRRALEDAGYGDGSFDREHTSVILGCGGGIGDLGQQYATRSEIPRFVGKVADETWERLPEWTEESFPGILLNVVAGRIASRFDFGGSNFTVDAACASSLAAIELAIKELETGRANVAIAGGVDTVQSPFTYFCFSKTQALSPRGRCHTFDQSGDGIAISEGIAMIVLKRLADAERDGDQIYAVIKAVAGSSDGKALGLTAPLPAGQRRALNRAYSKAGFSPNTLALYEAHGTGTAAGDRAELETLLQTLTQAQSAQKSCVLGSVKTMIGHTKSTAGVAALIKVALALQHKVLPPHRNVERPLEPISDPNSPVYLLKEPRPWLSHPNYPRRAAISAFGFGGTNFHAVLEEYHGEIQQRAPGHKTWPCELLVIRAENQQKLITEIEQLEKGLARGSQLRLRDLAYSYAQLAQKRSSQPACLTIVANNLKHLQDSLVTVLAHLKNQQTTPLPPHIQVGQGKPSIGFGEKVQHQPSTLNSQPPIAFLFSGQGSQYPQMLREVTLYFHEMRRSLEFADRQLQEFLPQPLSQYIYPPSPYTDAEEIAQHSQLQNTQIAQPSLGAMELGLFHLATQLGFKASFVGGHSYGEYAALYAAGVITCADFLRLSAIRGQVMAQACEKSDGGMAAVQINREQLLIRLKGFDGVVIANHNAPQQSVISGDKKQVEKVVDHLKQEGIKAIMLSVSGAFHTPLVAAASQPLAEAIAQTPLQKPQIPVYGNATARPYGDHSEAIRNQLSKHLLSTVEFVSQIEQMYADGARVFIELGPKNVLAKLTDQILNGKEHLAISFDGSGGGLQGLLRALGEFVLHGVDFNLLALFEGRDVQELDISRLATTYQQPQLAKSVWWVNGGSARPQTETVGHSGKLPPLNQETIAQTQAVQIPELAPPVSPLTPSPVMASTGKVSSTAIKPIQAERNGNSNTGIIAHAPVSLNPSPRIEVPSPRTSTTPRAISHQPTAMTSPSPIHSESSTNTLNFSTPSDALVAYQAYQETMRHFLKLEETVMGQFLNGISLAATPPSPPLMPRVPDTVSPVLSPTSAPAQQLPTIDRTAINGQVDLRSNNTTEIELRQAMTRGEFQLQYQPIVSLATGTITGFEAFVRWQHPQRGLISAAEFIPLAEATGLVVPLDQWILRQGCYHTVEWQSKFPGSSPLTLSINLSTEQFYQSDLNQHINQILKETGWNPHHLMLELKESGLQENPTLAITQIKRLKELGVLICWDNFGKGDSSLEFVLQFPLNAIKINRDLTREILNSPQKQALVKTLVQSCGQFNIEVIATGVETEEQLTHLQQLNIQSIQGYLFAKPAGILVGIQTEGILMPINREPMIMEVTPVASNVSPSVSTVPTNEPQFVSDRQSLTQILIDLVSDRTGYPIEMLGLDQDLEAELGIDSIKRVEILGALQKTLPSTIGNSVNQQMETLTRVKTLNGLVDKLIAIVQPMKTEVTLVGANDQPVPPKIPVPEPQFVTDRQSLTQILVDLVSDRTGYPIEMLGLDQDLEAELGIDSIKRVEILGALQKTLPSTIGNSVNQQMETLTRVKTLNGLVDKLITITTPKEATRLGKS